MKHFSIIESYQAAWHTLKAHSRVVFAGALVLTLLQLGTSILMPTTFDWPRIAAVILLGVLSAVVTIGYYVVCLRLVRKEVVHLGHLVPTWNLVWRYLLATILQTVAIMGGLILLIIPGIYVMVRLFFVGYSVVDGAHPFAALKRSGAVTHGVFWSVAGLLLSQAVLDWLGAATYLGLIITLPMTALASAHAYQKLKHHA